MKRLKAIVCATARITVAEALLHPSPYFRFLVQKSLVAVRYWFIEIFTVFPENLVCAVGPAVLNYDPKAVGWEQSIRIPGVVCNVCALASGSKRPLNTVPQQVK